MSNPAEKPEVVALPAGPQVAAPVNSRRVAAQRVREARDRLTSTSGTRPAFDAELLRQYAQTRISASYVVMLLVVATGVLFGLWMKPLSLFDLNTGLYGKLPASETCLAEWCVLKGMGQSRRMS